MYLVQYYEGKWEVLDKEGDVEGVYETKEEADNKCKQLNEYEEARGDYLYEQMRDDHEIYY